MPLDLAASALIPSTRRRRLGAFWLPARIATFPLPSSLLGPVFGHQLLAHEPIVDPVEGEALRGGRVAVEGHDRHAAGDGIVNGARDLPGVRARDQHGARPFVHRLRDPLCLNLTVLLRRGQPDHLDGNAGLARQLAGGIFGAAPGRQKDGVGRALGDQRDPDGLRARARVGGARRSRRRRRGRRCLVAGGEQRRARHGTGDHARGAESGRRHGARSATATNRRAAKRALA